MKYLEAKDLHEYSTYFVFCKSNEELLGILEVGHICDEGIEHRILEWVAYPPWGDQWDRVSFYIMNSYFYLPYTEFGELLYGPRTNQKPNKRTNK